MDQTKAETNSVAYGDIYDGGNRQDEEEDDDEEEEEEDLSDEEEVSDSDLAFPAVALTDPEEDVSPSLVEPEALNPASPIFIMLTSLLIILAVLGANVSSEHIRILGEPENGEVIPMAIVLKGRTMLSVSGQPDPPQPFFRPSFNLYDFDEQLEAIRIKSENVCYIKTYKFNETDIRKLIDDAITTKSKFFRQVTEEWNVREDEIPENNMLETVGPQITRFCDGYKVFWMEGGHEVKENDLMTRLGKRGFGISVSGSISVGSRSYSGSASASAGGGSASSEASSSSGSAESSSSSSSSSCR